MPILLELFLAFAKIGAFTFGGGYAMIALIEDCCVERKNWITHDEMMNLTVIAESTPGPISINCATYVGNKQAGFLGALVSTIGMVLPSFVIIYLISMFLDHFLEIRAVANAFRGIQVGVGILVLRAAVIMIQKMKKKPLEIGILITATLVMVAVYVFSFRFSSIALMLLAGLFSLTVAFVQSKTEQKGSGEA